MVIHAAHAAALLLGASLAIAGEAADHRSAPAAATRGLPQEPAAASSFEALAARAANAREAGQIEEALALYDRALTIRKDWDEGRWYLATLLYELDRHADARVAFVEVLRRQPGHAGALGLKGLCEFQLGRHQQALLDLLESDKLGIARSPGIATVVRYHAGILLTRFGDFEVGNRMLAHFAADGTETPQIHEAFGLNVLRMPMLPAELPAEARERVMLAGRAGYAMAARNVAAAGAALDELVRRYPSTPHAHYARGVFLLTENPEAALEEFRRELEVSPSHVPARLQIAFELLNRGNASAARGPAEEAAKLAPGHFTTRLALGQVLLANQELDRAIAELELAVKLEPSSPQTHFMLARAYARAGRTAEAERARAEFARLDRLARRTQQP